MKRHIVCGTHQMDNVFGKTTSGARLLYVDELTIGTVTLTQQYSTIPYQLKLPQTQGAANSFLSNNGSGLLTWKTESSLPFIDEVGIAVPSFLNVTNSPITPASISPTITIGLSGTALPTSSGGTGSSNPSTGTGGVVLRTSPTFTTSINTPQVTGSGAGGNLGIISTGTLFLNSTNYMSLVSPSYLDIRGGFGGTNDIYITSTRDVVLTATRDILLSAPTTKVSTVLTTPAIVGSGVSGLLAITSTGIVSTIADNYLFMASKSYLDIRGGFTGTNDIFMSATRNIFISSTSALVLGGNSYPQVRGSNGQVLTTNGAGSLSWQTPSGAGGGGGVSSVGMSVPVGGFLEVNGSTSATITTTGTFGITLGTLQVANGGTGVTTATGTGAVVRKTAPTLEDAILDTPEIADPIFTTDVVINESLEINNNFTVNHTAVGETNFNLGADGKFKISANSPSLASIEAITYNLIGASTFSVLSSGLGLINLISSGAGGILVKSSGTGNIDIETLGVDLGTGASVNLKAEGIGANVTLKSTGTGSISLTSQLLPSTLPSTITLDNTYGTIQLRTLKPATGAIQLISAYTIDLQAAGVIALGPAVSIQLESATLIRLSGPLSKPATAGIQLISAYVIDLQAAGTVGLLSVVSASMTAGTAATITAGTTATLTGGTLATMTSAVATTITSPLNTISGATTSITSAATNLTGATTTITSAATNLQGATTTITSAATNLQGAVTTITSAATNLQGAVTTITSASTNLQGAVTTITSAATNLQGAATTITSASINLTGAVTTITSAGTFLTGAVTTITSATVNITSPILNYNCLGVASITVAAAGLMNASFTGVGGLFNVNTGAAGAISLSVGLLGSINLAVGGGECKMLVTAGNCEITTGAGTTRVTSDSGNVILSSNNGAIQVIASQGGLSLGTGTSSVADRLCRLAVTTSNGSGFFEEGDVSFQTVGRSGAGGAFSGSCNFTVDTTIGYTGRIAHWSKGNFEIASNLNGLSRLTKTVNLNTSFLTGSYSFNFPTTSGFTGQVFTSGGPSNAISWTTTTGLDSIVRQRDPDFYNSINLYDYGSPGAGHFLSIYPSQVMTAPFALTLPPNSGTAGQILTTSGAAGILSWVNPTYTGILPVANGGTGSNAASTGTGGVVLRNSPTFTTDLATPVIYGSGPGGDLTVQAVRNLYLAGTSNGFSLPSSIVSLLSGGYINISAGDFGGSNDLYLTASRIIYVTGTDVRLGLVFYPTNVGALGQVLTMTNTGVGTARASWVTPNVSIISGTLGIANGGTGLSTIGANGTVLRSNGTTASWVTPAAPGTGTVTSVAVESGNSFITVSGSPITNSGTITVGISGPLTTNFGGTGSTGASTGAGGVVLRTDPQFTAQLRTPKVVGSGTSGNLALTSTGTLNFENDGWIYLNSNWNLGTAPIGSIRGFAFGWNNSGGDGENILTYYTGAGSNPRLDICSWNGATRTTRLTIDNSGALCTPSIKGTGTSGDLTIASTRTTNLTCGTAVGEGLYVNTRRIDATQGAMYTGTDSSTVGPGGEFTYKPPTLISQSSNFTSKLSYNSTTGQWTNTSSTESLLITASYSFQGIPLPDSSLGVNYFFIRVNGVIDTAQNLVTVKDNSSGTSSFFLGPGNYFSFFFRVVGGNDCRYDSGSNVSVLWRYA